MATPADDLLARHRKVMPSWAPVYYAEPIEIVSGSGCRVTDSAGRTYLDFFGGVLTTSIGYDVPEVRAAVQRQLATGVTHTSTLYLIRAQVELAEKIARLSGIPDARVFFTTSGTEANDTALLLATTYRRSNTILAMRNSYHGRSFSAVGITGNRGWSPTSLSPLQTLYVHGGVRTRGPYADLDDRAFIAACVDDLKDLLGHTRPPAALIAEPIQGVGGFTSGPDGLYAAFREVLAERGILWIADEVQTGWGRTGDHFWGWQAHGHNGPPDIVTFAKGIGNGMSIGGVIARSEIMNCLDANSISTFGGTQITMAAGLANLTYLLEHDLQGNARRVGGLLIERLRASGPPHARLPAVAVTAYGSIDDRVRALAAGFGAHLAKPVDIDELVATIRRLLGRSEES